MTDIITCNADCMWGERVRGCNHLGIKLDDRGSCIYQEETDKGKDES